MTYLTRLALAGTLALGTGGMAFAATYADCEADIADNLTSALGCEVRTDATQDFIEPVMTVNEGEPPEEQTGFFGINTWTFVAKDDGNPAPGAYDFTGLFEGMVGDVLVVFKKGQYQLVGYLLGTDDLTGSWTSPFFPSGASDEDLRVSHITVYGNVAPIPVPAAGLLMLGALGALGGVAARRRKG